MSDNKPSGQLYVESAQRLRDSVGRNKSDAALADIKGMRIVYIFDANVFLFHSNIEDDTRLTGHLNNLVGNSDAALSATLDRLTAKFLFSGRLPAQADEKCYISNAHFEEVIDQCAVIARRLTRSFDKDVQRQLADVNNLTAELEEVLNTRSSAAHKISVLANRLPQAWIAALNTAGHFRNAIEDAFDHDGGRLVPLDRTSWGADASRELWSTEIGRAHV